MKDPEMFEHHPDPELGAALRAALAPQRDQAAFVAGVMAHYDAALERSAIPTLDVLASWLRPGLAAAALIAGFFVGRVMLAPPATPVAAESIDAAMAPAEGPGLAALVTAQDPPDASVVLTSLVEPQ